MISLNRYCALLISYAIRISFLEWNYLYNCGILEKFGLKILRLRSSMLSLSIYMVSDEWVTLLESATFYGQEEIKDLQRGMEIVYVFFMEGKKLTKPHNFVALLLQHISLSKDFSCEVLERCIHFRLATFANTLLIFIRRWRLWAFGPKSPNSHCWFRISQSCLRALF